MGRSKLLIFGFVGVALAACTTVTVEERGGATRLSRHAGFLSIEVAPSSQGVAVSSMGLGLVRTPTGIVLGFNTVRMLALGEGCRVVLWVENEEQLRLLEELLGDLSNVCVAEQY